MVKAGGDSVQKSPGYSLTSEGVNLQPEILFMYFLLGNLLAAFTLEKKENDVGYRCLDTIRSQHPTLCVQYKGSVRKESFF